ncbi:MAG: LPS assembly lipoprotein LptE [Vicinamibacteria bacterium]
MSRSRRAFLAGGARLSAAAVAASAAQACGYALVGRGITTDPTIRRIGVPLFVDRTGRPGLDQKITAKVIEELLKRGRFDVVQESTGVDALVEGEVSSFQFVPIGFAGEPGQTTATRYAIVLSSKVTYSKTGVDEPLWENPSFQAREETDVGDAETFFDREDQVLDRLIVSFARGLVAAMLEAF